jgi:transposase-like protein
MSDACPKCQSTGLTLFKRPTSLGYPRFRCKRCRCTFNERSGTVFKVPHRPRLDGGEVEGQVMFEGAQPQ